MGAHERQAWMDHIARLDVPDPLKHLMRDLVTAHDQLLGHTLVTLELASRRATADDLAGTLQRLREAVGDRDAGPP